MKLFIEKTESGCELSELTQEILQNLKKGIYEVNFKKIHKNRTLPENKYYWGCIIGDKNKKTGLSFFLGNESNDIHDVLTEKFLTVKTRVPTDRRKKIKTIRSTSDLTTVEFEEYCENIRSWAKSYLKFVIPLPNENNDYPEDYFY